MEEKKTRTNRRAAAAAVQYIMLFAVSLVGFLLLLDFVKWLNTGGIQYLTSLLPERIQERIVEVAPPEKTLAELLDEIPAAYHVDRVLVEGIIRTESNYVRNAVRYEPHHITRSDVQRYGKGIPEQTRLYSSSLGYMQIMGWQAPPLDLQWDDLLDPETNIEVGTKILRSCLDRYRSERSSLIRVRKALICYNGHQDYPDRVMRNIGEIMVRAMTFEEETEVQPAQESEDPEYGWRIKGAD